MLERWREALHILLLFLFFNKWKYDLFVYTLCLPTAVQGKSNTVEDNLDENEIVKSIRDMTLDPKDVQGNDLFSFWKVTTR